MGEQQTKQGLSLLRESKKTGNEERQDMLKRPLDLTPKF